MLSLQRCVCNLYNNIFTCEIEYVRHNLTIKFDRFILSNSDWLVMVCLRIPVSSKNYSPAGPSRGTRGSERKAPQPQNTVVNREVGWKYFVHRPHNTQHTQHMTIVALGWSYVNGADRLSRRPTVSIVVTIAYKYKNASVRWFCSGFCGVELRHYIYHSM